MKKATFLGLAFILFLLVGSNYAQSVKMNEIFARGTAADLDWIELYNSSAADIDISGYKIYDSAGNTDAAKKMLIPSGTVLPAKGFYVVTTDIDKTLNGFGLSSSGEDVWLEDNTGTVIDNLKFLATTDATQSYGRVTNGATWAVLNTITKGLSNSVIVMNEIYSNGKSATHPDLDWIELYNSSAAQVDVSGYKIYDSGGNTDAAKKMVLASGTVIPAKSYLVITTDIDKTLNGFGLSSGGEEVWLEDNTGAVIDNIKFTALTETQTYSRIPDAGNWKAVTGLTKAKTNGTGTSIKANDQIATDYKLQQNYPNPFNPSTKIEYSIPQSGYVTLKIYDVLGNEIYSLVNGFMNAGNYVADFNASSLTSGVYFYKLQAGSFSKVNKMMLVK